MSLLLAATLFIPAPQDPAPPQFEVVALEHAVAAEAALVLADMVPEAKVMADPRVNALLVMADPPEMADLKDAIVALDQDVATQPGDLFPVPSEDLVVAVGEGGTSWTMMDLVQEYGRLTGQHMQVNQDTRSYLEQAQTGLTRSVVVPKDQVQTFFEGLLIESDFILSVVREQEPRLLKVTSMQTGSRNTIRRKALFVPSDRLADWAHHRAILITTTVTMPNTDVRQLSNSMRTLIIDANIQQMLPAGNTNTLVLVGIARDVAAQVELLRQVDAAAAQEIRAPQFRRFQLAHADAAVTAPMIEDLIRSSNGYNEGQAVRQSTTNPPPWARVRADERTNALVVMCMPTDLPRIEELVRLFDVKQD